MIGYHTFAYFDLLTGATLTVDGVSAAMLGARDLLVDAGLFGPNACVVSLDPEPFLSPAPPMCAISPEPFSAGEPELTGGGRYELVLDGAFTMNVVLRHAKDVAGQDTLFLTSVTAGGYPFVMQCINVLLEQFIFDADGVQVTTRGLKLASIGRPHAYRGDKMMGVVPVTFRARVMTGITLPDLGLN